MVVSQIFLTLQKKQKHYFFLSFHLYFNFVFFKQKEMLCFFMYIALYINIMINNTVERFFTYDRFATDL